MVIELATPKIIEMKNSIFKDLMNIFLKCQSFENYALKWYFHNLISSGIHWKFFDRDFKDRSALSKRGHLMDDIQEFLYIEVRSMNRMCSAQYYHMYKHFLLSIRVTLNVKNDKPTTSYQNLHKFKDIFFYVCKYISKCSNLVSIFFPTHGW